MLRVPELRTDEFSFELVLASAWGRASAFQTAMLSALAHPWRTGDRGVVLGALAIAYLPEFLSTPEFRTHTQQVDPLFPSTPEGMATVAEQWDADLAHDTLHQLTSISAPTVAIGGEQDLLTPIVVGLLAANAIPGAQWHVFTGPVSSQATLFERTDEFTQLVLEFLNQIPVLA
ncbi:alpha/beta fold hydrolase [Cryobacterium sp. Y11]|uniref:alpha/beta fold hydrolase n=1 Tax=Cryobacterium sp. Y11 TaxID=2045016 RepID=UPI0011B05579|nr:alpha/beta hydrolase [Cryobacterium sp. Y11]